MRERYADFGPTLVAEKLSEAAGTSKVISVSVPRDYTPSELQVACLPYMRQTATTLEQAHALEAGAPDALLEGVVEGEKSPANRPKRVALG